jgi:hypothetical protein
MCNIRLIGIVTANPPHNQYIWIKKFIIKKRKHSYTSQKSNPESLHYRQKSQNLWISPAKMNIAKFMIYYYLYYYICTSVPILTTDLVDFSLPGFYKINK